MKIKNWSKVKEGSLLLVTWDDIVSNASWLSEASAKSHPAVECKDIGWLTSADKKNIRLSSSINAMGERNVTVIPIGCIRDTVRL